MTELRHCKKCDKNYPLTKEYWIANRGKLSVCKLCKKEYAKSNKENISRQKKNYYRNNKKKIRDQIKQYRQNNKERIREQTKEYRQNNIDKIKECNKKYRYDNKERRAQQDKDFYQNNKEKVKERVKEYKRNNKELCSIHTRRRRAYKRSNCIPYTKNQLEQYLNCFGCSIANNIRTGNCFYCKLIGKIGPFEHLDHAIPLSKGGCDALINFIPSCEYHNCSKKDKTFKEFVAELKPYYKK